MIETGGLEVTERYGANIRIYEQWLGWESSAVVKSSINPTYKCQDIEDKHTVSGDTWGGNGKLSKPIALLTVDEVIFAGGFPNLENSNYFLYLNSEYPLFTMSPSGYNGEMGAYLFVIINGKISSKLLYQDRNYSGIVLPIISIKGDLEVANGDGTHDNPYVVE